MSTDVQRDASTAFDAARAHDHDPRADRQLSEQELESAWFDAPRRSSRFPRSSAPPASMPALALPRPSPSPIDAPVADDWFR